MSERDKTDAARPWSDFPSYSPLPTRYHRHHGAATCQRQCEADHRPADFAPCPWFY